MAASMDTTLRQTWVRVVDRRGRAHLEARWVAAHQTPADTPAAPVHAA